jgi:class 3 adenylate cyclase
VTDERPPNPYVRGFSSPDEHIDATRLRSEVITIGGVKVSYDVQQPGWRWSTHARPIVGTEWCEVHHVGVVLSGRMGWHLRDGTEFEAGPMEVVDIPPGHDAWVIGDVPFVRLAWGGVAGRLSPPDLDRVLLTVLFMDIVDSTRVAATMGDRGWKELLTDHHRRTREIVERFRGSEVDAVGDGFFFVFDSPARAVRCAEAVVQAVRPMGIEVRAGAHTGEVETVDGKAGGLAVVIGARIGGLAGPSEILVSRTVKDLTAGSELRFEDAGDHELKGVPDRWPLYRLVPSTAPVNPSSQS